MTSPWLTTQEAAAWLRYQGPCAPELARRFCLRHDIPMVRRGRRWLVLFTSLEAHLRQRAS